MSYKFSANSDEWKERGERKESGKGKEKRHRRTEELMTMATAFARVKVSQNGWIHIPEELQKICEIQEGREVLLYGRANHIVLSTQPLSEEELVDIDMANWSIDIDERIRRQDDELIQYGILTEEDFT